MRLLEPLVRRDAESRYTLDDYAAWVSEWFQFGGWHYPIGVQTTQTGQLTEPIASNFLGHVQAGLKGNGIVGALELVRLQVFSQARFIWRSLRNGRPAELFGTPELRILEEPWPQGTTDQLLARMLLDVDLAGNAYVFRDGDVLVPLRPDWVDIVVAQRRSGIGYDRIGYFYWDEGQRSGEPAVLLPDEVAHWVVIPDPLASYRGMSWLTPVVREIQGDTGYTQHKIRFLDNAATPNLAVRLSDAIGPDAFEKFVEKMEAGHKGVANAYKTLYLGGGADVTVVGSNMQQLDFKLVQGAGETRLAAAAGVGAVMAQFSEGLAGSSLNAGNYAAARRRFADVTARHLWMGACAALSKIVNVPSGAELWFDEKFISFLQEDAKDAAEIAYTKALTIRQLIDAGFKAESVTKAIDADDFTLLDHSGLFSVQMQKPGSEDPAPEDV